MHLHVTIQLNATILLVLFAPHQLEYVTVQLIHQQYFVIAHMDTTMTIYSIAAVKLFLKLNFMIIMHWF